MRSRIRPVFWLAVLGLLVSTSAGHSPKTARASSATAIWPLPERQGKVCLSYGYVVQPKLKRQIFSEGYCIAVPEDTPVLAMGDGRVIVANLAYMVPELNRSFSFSAPPGSRPDSLNAAIRDAARRAGVPPSHFYGQVILDLGGGRKVFYGGLALKMPVHEGQQVKQGEIVGYSGHYRAVTDEPAIWISLSRLGKTSDIGVMLFGPDHVSKDSLFVKPVYDPARRYPAAGLRADLQLLRAALEEGHPGIYAYTAKTVMDSLFDSAQAAIDRDLTENEFVEILEPVIGAMRCNHTSIIRSIAYEERARRVLPFSVYFDAGRCWATQNYGLAPRIQPGTEILTIDGRTPAEMCARIARAFYPDGYNTTFQKAMSEGYFPVSGCEILGDPKSVKVRIRTAAGAEEEFVQATAPVGEFAAAQRRSLRKAVAKREFSFEILSPQCAYMNIPRFDMMNSDDIQKWFAELDAKQIPNLIVDLRSNAGGPSANLGYLYSFFAKTPFRPTLYSRATRDSTYSFFKDTDNRFEGMSLDGPWREVPGRAGYFKDGPVFQPQSEHRFCGRIYVLINGRSLSAAAIMAGLLLQNNDAILIGTETGGGFYQLNAEEWAELRLKTAPLTIHFPLLQLVFTEERLPRIPWGHGVVPDHAVRGSLQDVIDQVDRPLEFAKSLIAGGGGR